MNTEESSGKDTKQAEWELIYVDSDKCQLLPHSTHFLSSPLPQVTEQLLGTPEQM
jgi:hypothetical protein